MSFDSNFGFAHFQPKPKPELDKALAPAALAAPKDLLGPLRGFVGSTGKRTWTGKGFNLIWRPNHGQTGTQDFFLELNLTTEELDFQDITGTGVANRGFNQNDIALGAVNYLQKISDVKRGPQHFEPGVWICDVDATVDPKEPPVVTRMGSIPHGTTVNLQGVAVAANPLKIDATTITPFQVGSADDGNTNLVHFPEEKNITTPMPSRTPPGDVVGLDDAHLANPNLFLTDALKGLTVLSAEALLVTSEVNSALAPADQMPPAPDAGGGSDSIAFLVKGSRGPNALPARVTSTFWIERVRDQHGKEFDQIQYTQRVLLNFNNLSWPHISVATLR